MKIGIDIDNTVGMYLQEFCNNANDLYGTKLTINAMTSPDVKFESLGLLSTEQVMTIKSLDEVKQTFRYMAMYKDARKYLRLMLNQPYIKIYFISNRDNYDNELMLKHTHDWFKEHGIHNYHDVVFTKTKDEYAQKYALDYFIEDNIGETNRIAPYVERVFVLNRPWTLGQELPENAQLVRDWHEIYEAIGRNA